MESNINNELNTSTSSWDDEKLMEEYEKESEKIANENEKPNHDNDFETFLPQTFISNPNIVLMDESVNTGCNSDVSVRQVGNKKFIVKKNSADSLTNNNRTAQAINSAFLSCFTHTPFPVGVKDESIIWRYDETDPDIKQYQQYIGLMFNFCSALPDDIILPFLKKEQYQDGVKRLLSQKKGQLHKYLVQMLMYQSFFSMYDRKAGNMVFGRNTLSQIDIEDEDMTGYDEYRLFFFYFNDYTPGISCAEKIFLLERFADKQKTLNFIEKTATKINNINYDKFIDRYIRNCVVLNIDEKTAFKHLTTFKDIFAKNENNFFKNQLQPLEKNINQRLDQLKEESKKTKESINLNDIEYLQKKMNDESLTEEQRKFFANKMLERFNSPQEERNEEQSLVANAKEQDILGYRLQIIKEAQASEIFKTMQKCFDNFAEKVKTTQFFQKDNEETEKDFYEKFRILKEKKAKIKNTQELQQKKINESEPKETLKNKQVGTQVNLNK